jgi:D-glycero-D-manno-heptose 1,7-bisphosphate phosphatase
MVKQAVILAGGKGTRLGTLTDAIPKPMLPVGDKPFLYYPLWNLRRHGIKDIIITTGYLSDYFDKNLNAIDLKGMNISFFRETKPLGTGGALTLLKEKLDDTFFVLNGDTILDVNYLSMSQTMMETNADAVIALRKVKDSSQYGAITIKNKTITAFKEKTNTSSSWINGGVYLLKRVLFEELKAGPLSLENEFFPNLLKQTEVRLVSHKAEDFFLDIGLPTTYKTAQNLIPSWQRRPAVFFDRDGVINQDYAYVHKIEEFDWITGSKEAILWCNNNGYLAILVTNQAGIGRGYYSEEDFAALTLWMQKELSMHGAHFDAVYYCPHHPEYGKGRYKKDCWHRKPNPGMLEKALSEWPIDKAHSFLIGDKKSDLLAAQRIGIKSIRYDEGPLIDLVKSQATLINEQNHVG